MNVTWEALAALAVGVFLLALVLQPLVAGADAAAGVPLPEPLEGLEADETASGLAVSALREIEFDRATGKLSDADYAFLKARYTARALEALRAEQRAPGNELEAMVAGRVAVLEQAAAATTAEFDAATGEALGTGSCRACGVPHVRGAYYCEACGTRLAAR